MGISVRDPHARRESNYIVKDTILEQGGDIHLKQGLRMGHAGEL